MNVFIPVSRRVKGVKANNFVKCIAFVKGSVTIVGVRVGVALFIS